MENRLVKFKFYEKPIRPFSCLPFLSFLLSAQSARDGFCPAKRHRF